MFPSQDDFNQDQAKNTQNNDIEKNLERIDVNISLESVAVRKQQLEKIFIKLIVFGLALGTILGIGTYYLLHKFGLTKRPDQLEQERIQRQREENSPAAVKKIINFPSYNNQDKQFKL